MTLPYGAKAKKSFCDPSSDKPCITVCTPRPGCTCDCEGVKNALIDELARRSLRNVTLGALKVGCQKGCATGPFIGFPQRGYYYLGVKPEMIPVIVEETLINGRILFPLLSLNTDRAFRPDLYYEKETGLLAAIDAKVSMVDVAKYFLDYEDKISCSKCEPCRVGIKNLYECMGRILAGDGSIDDVEEMVSIAQAMVNDPKCVFPSGSSKPLLSALTLFEDEFRAIVGPSRPKPPPVIEEPPAEPEVAAEPVSEAAEPAATAEVPVEAVPPEARVPAEAPAPAQVPVAVEAAAPAAVPVAVEPVSEPATAPVEEKVEAPVVSEPEPVDASAPVAAEAPAEEVAPELTAEPPAEVPEPEVEPEPVQAVSEVQQAEQPVSEALEEEPAAPEAPAAEEVSEPAPEPEKASALEAKPAPAKKGAKKASAGAGEKTAKASKSKTKKDKPRKQKKGS